MFLSETIRIIKICQQLCKLQTSHQIDDGLLPCLTDMDCIKVIYVTSKNESKKMRAG